MYGTPDDRFLREVVLQEGWGLTLHNGKARDVVFTVYEDLSRADAIVAFPNAHPFQLVMLLAEAEVGHPLITQNMPSDGSPVKEFETKPIVFMGKPEEWEPFQKIFSEMKEQGLIRDGFDRLAHYADTPEEVRRVIKEGLPEEIPSTRLHYYLHTKKEADLGLDLKEDVRPPSDITVACFGSASTRDSAHLERTERAAKVLARSGYNILHGGGTGGVMHQLSESGAKYKAYVIGVTVDSSGAPKIFFEKSDGNARPELVDEQIASKDMLHRIESYAGNSNAFLSLDGGIGSLEEVLVVAELLSKDHPVMKYLDQKGEWVKKPLIVLNEGGIYTPFLEYAARSDFSYLADHIQIAQSTKELEEMVTSHFREHPPASRERNREFRELYREVDLPMAPVTRVVTLPSVDSLGAEQPNPREVQERAR